MRRALSPIVLTSLSTVSIASADPAMDAVHVTYDAPADCPTAESFIAQVRARTARVRVAAEPDPSSLQMAVSISTSNGASSGRLTIHDGAGRETVRTVSGDTCGEVASALALVSALAIDPDATSLAPSPPVSVPPPPPPVPVSTLPNGDAVRDAVDRSRGLEASVAGGVALAGGVAPDVLLGASGTLGIAFGLGPLLPALRLGFVEASGSPRADAGPSASFTWNAGTIEACPHRFFVAGLRFEPCGRFEGGTVHAAGSNVVPAREDTHAWVTVGVAGHVEFTVATTERVFVELEGGARASLYRTRYVFEPDSTYYRAPLVAGFAGAGIGLHFL